MNFPEKLEDFRCVTAFTPTVCTLIGARIPAQCEDTPLDAVIAEAEKKLNGEKVEKMLIFAPDACGIHLWERYPEKLAKVEAVAPLRVPTKVVMPSVTPVCFASMYTGATPAIHGIQKYERPILTVETIFNTFPEAKKKTGICAVNQCSIDLIFRKRPVTYCSTRSDAEAVKFSHFLMQDPAFDVVLNYATDYDHIMHATGPFADEAIGALDRNIAAFQQFSAWIDEYWGAYNRLLVWSPDHGAHESSPGRGPPGTDMPEDLLVYHFYSIRAKNK